MNQSMRVTAVSAPRARPNHVHWPTGIDTDLIITLMMVRRHNIDRAYGEGATVILSLLLRSGIGIVSRRPRHSWDEGAAVVAGALATTRGAWHASTAPTTITLPDPRPRGPPMASAA